MRVTSCHQRGRCRNSTNARDEGSALRRRPEPPDGVSRPAGGLHRSAPARTCWREHARAGALGRAYGTCTDGTHSSRRWISVTSSAPNWLLMLARVVPNPELDFDL